MALKNCQRTDEWVTLSEITSFYTVNIVVNSNTQMLKKIFCLWSLFLIVHSVKLQRNYQGTERDFLKYMKLYQNIITLHKSVYFCYSLIRDNK